MAPTPAEAGRVTRLTPLVVVVGVLARIATNNHEAKATLEDPEYLAEAKPEATLDRAHLSLADEFDDHRRLFQSTGEDERAEVVRTLQRQLTLDGWAVSRDELRRFLSGDDAARPLSFPAIGAEQILAEGGLWRDRLFVEDVGWERGVLRRRQEQGALLAVQVQVPTLALDYERGNIRGLALSRAPSKRGDAGAARSRHDPCDIRAHGLQAPPASIAGGNEDVPIVVELHGDPDLTITR